MNIVQTFMLLLQKWLRVPPLILDCGGKQSATSLCHGSRENHRAKLCRPKAPSPLRSAGAVRILVLAVLTLCFHAAGEQTNQPTPITARDFYNAGTRLLDDGKYTDAEQMFESALATQNARVQPLAVYNLGHARFDDGVKLLKKGPNAQHVAAQGNAALAAGATAIQRAQSALASGDLFKMIDAYLEGRGARHELRAAEKAVQAAMEAYGKTLRKWQRAADDFKSAAELNPADTNATRNAQIVEEAIAKLVDSLHKMQAMMGMMGKQRQQLDTLMKQLHGRIPASDAPPGVAGEDDDDMQPGSLIGHKEGASREGKEMQLPLSPNEAGQILNGLMLDGSRRLPMSVSDQKGTPSNERKGRNW